MDLSNVFWDFVQEISPNPDSADKKPKTAVDFRRRFSVYVQNQLAEISSMRSVYTTPADLWYADSTLPCLSYLSRMRHITLGNR